MSPIEVVAAAFGLLSVVFTVRRSLLCWPTGLAMVALYAFIFYEAKLYSDAGLQIVYVVLQVYGWWHWARVGPGEELPVGSLGRAGRLGWSAVALGAAGTLGFAMSTWTDASFPYLDAFITTTSLVAQWLMARKVWESWVGWIAVDLVAVPVYYARDLFPTAALYSLFLGLALSGLVTWRRNRPAASSSGSSSPRTAATSTS